MRKIFCVGASWKIATELLCALAFIGFSISTSSTVRSDWKDDIGHTQLKAEKGPGLETGAAVVVAMAEAWVSSSYLPDLNSPQFSGKQLIDGSNLQSGTSSHANAVAGLFFGNTASIAPGVSNITLFQADDWLNRVTGLSSGADPQVQNFRIMNNSWIGNVADANVRANILRRVDYVVYRDDVLVVAGSSNGANSAVPHLLASGYNSLIVGVTSGSHGHGLTTVNGSGRITPHLVAPASNTSSATPMVSSAAALLHERATGTDAARSESMRAILMAGATKHQFAGWDRTVTRPLDNQFGAGQVNVYNSYKILEGGQFAGSTTAPTFSVGVSGWDYVSQISAADTLYYNFQVDSQSVMNELSIMLNWNLQVLDLNPSLEVFNPTTSLANLDMRFYDSTDGFQATLLDASLSTVDNFEHLYLANLGPGTYTLAISSTSGTTAFGLAWRGSITAVPEPGHWIVLMLGASIIAWKVRAQRRKETSRLFA